MPVYLCTACGTSFPPADAPPGRCPICTDERQFVPSAGQSWTTRDALAGQHRNAWRTHAPGLLSLHTVPRFGIDQRALLLRTPAGNVLWDCIALLDDATRDLVAALGGLAAIAISHPHYYTTMADWADAFAAPVHLHAADRAWVARASSRLQFWEGETREILPGITLIRVGGHFAGGTVLHWADAADGAGALLAGDIVQVTPGQDRVSFQWSYPNMMPLPAAAVGRIAARLQPWRFAQLFGAFMGQDVLADASGMVARSAARYVELLGADPDRLEAGRA